MDMPVGQPDRRIGGERRRAGQHLKQHAAQGVQVGLQAGRAARGLLRGQVRRGTQHHRRPGDPGPALGPGNAEVQDLDLGAGQHDVRRRDVAVHQPGRMRHLQRLADRRGDPHRLCGRHHPGLIQDLPQGPARDQLHHDERPLAVHAGVEHRHQPRVTQPRRMPGLPVKPGQETRISRVLRTEHLDRDLAAQHLIPGPPHRGHTAGAQHLTQHIPAAQDPGTGHRHESAPGCPPARSAPDRARDRELPGQRTARNSVLPAAASDGIDRIRAA